ncbi:single-stranded DNA-binding protein [Clostridium sp.]|uniref:single-stranded DNA-binding protein n=1 Tax=Clostridium sp. TaxID=1506 RepID=UPI003217A9BA
MNLVVIEGNLAKDPNLQFTPNGKAKAKFTVAASTGYGDKKKVAYVNCIAWNKTAEAIANYTHKGSSVRVKGIIETGDYEGKNGKVYFTQVLVDQYDGIKFLDSKNNNSSSNQGNIPGDYFGGADMIEDDSDSMPF